MEFMDFIVKKHNSKTSKLDKDYTRFIEGVISNKNEQIEERWEIYNLIIRELFEIDDCKFFEEIKYRITDNESPNVVLLDIISRYSTEEVTYLLYSMGKKLEEFEEEDFFKRFY